VTTTIAARREHVHTDLTGGVMAEADDGAAPGPIDFIVIEFPPGQGGGATARALLDLVDGGVVRLLDLMVVRKDSAGACEEIDLTGADADLAALAPFAGARSGLLGVDDLDDAASLLDADSVAMIIVYENAWASPFVTAAHAEGGVLVASARLTAQEILDALDAVEASS
jgi:hypothetical protein